MFKVYLLNNGYQVGDNYATIEQAMDKAKSTGFECVILETKNIGVHVEKNAPFLVMEFSPISGFKCF